MKLAVAVVFCLGIVSAIPHPQRRDDEDGDVDLNQEELFATLPGNLQEAFQGLTLRQNGFPTPDEIIAAGVEAVIATFEEASTREFNRLTSNDPQETGLNASGCRDKAGDVRDDGITDSTRRDLSQCLQNVEPFDAIERDFD